MPYLIAAVVLLAVLVQLVGAGYYELALIAACVLLMLAGGALDYYMPNGPSPSLPFREQDTKHRTRDEVIEGAPVEDPQGRGHGRLSDARVPAQAEGKASRDPSG